MKPISLAVVLVAMSASVASAGLIERACLKSDRKAANRLLCGCIQDVADLTLTRSEQKRASQFFRDPHMAQVVRQSDRASDEILWQKWKAFGASAQNYCG